MNPADFTEDSPGRLVRIPEGGHAFVPHPLPLNFSLDLETVHLLSEASRNLGELQGLAQSLPNPHLLVGPFLRREAQLSSRIEGTYATQEEVAIFDADPVAQPEKSDVREVSNYIAAVEYGLKRLPDLPISLRLIRELHERLMKGVRGSDRRPGEFRDKQNWIGSDREIANARFVPPPAGEMVSCLDAFERYWHAPSLTPVLVRLALLHYQFEAIHPFEDGNGRIGRLLIPLLLCESQLLARPLLYLSAYFEKRRKQYYDHLLHVSQRGAIQPWVQFFLSAVIEQAKESAMLSQKLFALRQKYQEMVRKKRASALAADLIDSLFVTPGLTINSAAKVLKVSYPSAQLAVEKLVEAGILHETLGRKRNRLFIASGILSTLTVKETED